MIIIKKERKERVWHNYLLTGTRITVKGFIYKREGERERGRERERERRGGGGEGGQRQAVGCLVCHMLSSINMRNRNFFMQRRHKQFV